MSRTYVPRSNDRIQHVNCVRYETKLLRGNTRFQCAHCTAATRDLNRRISKSHSEEGLAAKRDVSSPWKSISMTPTSQRIRNVALMAELRKRRRQLGAAHDVIDKLKANAVERDFEPEVALGLSSMFSELYKNGSAKEVLVGLVETMFTSKSNLFAAKSDATEEEKEEKLEELKESSAKLVSLLYEQLEMFSYRFAGKAKQVTISDDLLNLSIELHGCPAMYERLRKAGWLMLPSRATMLNHKSEFKVHLLLFLAISGVY
ncbi:hypothetical protein HDU98_005743 [Podochytrium sp. JEL0797]|nr:hypothetical protein HDU98_005743 [Podochytrium sp. JEL0797]